MLKDIIDNKLTVEEVKSLINKNPNYLMLGREIRNRVQNSKLNDYYPSDYELALEIFKIYMKKD